MTIEYNKMKLKLAKALKNSENNEDSFISTKMNIAVITTVIARNM